jgi:hypothetical protein
MGRSRGVTGVACTGGRPVPEQVCYPRGALVGAGILGSVVVRRRRGWLLSSHPVAPLRCTAAPPGHRWWSSTWWPRRPSRASRWRCATRCTTPSCGTGRASRLRRSERRGGRLRCFGSRAAGTGPGDSQCLLARSDADGATWSSVCALGCQYPCLCRASASNPRPCPCQTPLPTRQGLRPPGGHPLAAPGQPHSPQRPLLRGGREGAQGPHARAASDPASPTGCCAAQPGTSASCFAPTRPPCALCSHPQGRIVPAEASGDGVDSGFDT